MSVTVRQKVVLPLPGLHPRTSARPASQGRQGTHGGVHHPVPSHRASEQTLATSASVSSWPGRVDGLGSGSGAGQPSSSSKAVASLERAAGISRATQRRWGDQKRQTEKGASVTT